MHKYAFQSLNQETAATATAGLAALAALSLRSPANSKALFDAGTPEVIVSAMKRHLDQKTVQVTKYWAAFYASSYLHCTYRKQAVGL